MYSEEDSIIPVTDISSWGDYFDKVTYVRAHGDHFFPYNSLSVEEVCNAINIFIEAI